MVLSLQAFLSKYVDENAVYRRRSQSEDDNPPSPVTMDSDGAGGNVSFLGHHRSGPQSPAQQREGLRFHPPLTPPSGSNPHTPASPHTANISQVSPKYIHPTNCKIINYSSFYIFVLQGNILSITLLS